jgi:site-specific recombinase XerD
MRSTFSILFYVNKQKTKKNGKCPVMCRITVNGKPVQLSLQEDTDPTLWSVADGCTKGKDKADKDLNLKLGQLRVKATSLYTQQIEQNGLVTAESLKAALQGTSKEPMLLELFGEYLSELAQSTGITTSKCTLSAYKGIYTALCRYLKDKCRQEDYPISQLDYAFIENFDFYLRAERQLKPRTVHGYVEALRFMGRRAVRKGLRTSNPFEGFVNKSIDTATRKWLTKEEIDRLLHTPMKKKKSNLVRNLFLFSTFTGLSIVDVTGLQWKYIVTDNNGIQWIRMPRGKTGVESCVPLLPIPLQILAKYGRKEKEGLVFDTPKYRTVALHLHEVGEACGIEYLTFHVSRHTWATTICLSNGVPIETLSRTMGHSNISTTQIYGKITNQKINEDMTKLEQRLGGKFQFGNRIVEGDEEEWQ